MAELSYHVKIINVFNDVNSTLYTVRNIHHKGGFLLKVILNIYRLHTKFIFLVILQRKTFLKCKLNLIHEKDKKQPEIRKQN